MESPRGSAEVNDDEKDWWEPGPPFPNPVCPCGDEQPDDHRLYCEDCIERMARGMAEEMEDS